MSKLAGAYSAIAIILLNTLILTLIVELTLGAAWRAQTILDSHREDLSGLRAAYPGRSEDEIRAIRREHAQANAFSYLPWTQFSVRDFAGRHVKVKDALRASEPASSGPGAGKVATVDFYGGSTMWGFNVADADTIPSRFAKVWNAEATGMTVSVTNFGQPYWFSAQEVIQFLHNVRRGRVPNVAIFLDGVNDTLQRSASYHSYPFFTPHLEALMTEFSSAGRGTGPVASFTAALRATYTYTLLSRLELFQKPGADPYAAPGGKADADVAREIGQNYRANVKLASDVCRSQGIACLFFWQPAPFYHYGNPNDRIAARDARPELVAIYDEVKKSRGAPGSFHWLGDELSTFSGQAFVDRYHYSGAFNEHLAGRMRERAVEALNGAARGG
jgi:hypothetical protein